MREIKFRFWHKEEKKMYPTFNEYLDGYSLEMLFIEEDNGGLIPMQFTGLHDKNNKEIYEGDIVEKESIYEIVFNKAGFTVKNLDSKTSCPASNQFLGVYADRLEVIGNIHEDTHLLNKD